MFDSLPPVLETGAMREADRRTIEDFGIPGFTLMELAGRAVADEATVMLGDDSPARVVVFCGKGNNGGDGFVAARWLQQTGCSVEVVLFCEPSALSGDADSHFRILEKILEAEGGIQIRVFSSIEDLETMDAADLYVDALLGTGLSSSVRKPLSDAIEWLNAQHAPILAADLPSGLNSDNGQVMGHAVRAAVTVTMGALKAGLLINDGPDYSGSIVVADIGIPYHVLNSVSEASEITGLCRPDFVRNLIPGRDRESHKYASGPTLVFGGSPEFPGAVVLAATAAARVGSGYVVAISQNDTAEKLAEKLTEIPVASIEMREGKWDFDALVSDLGIRWDKARSILIGPGLGRLPETRTLVMELLQRSKIPVVVDADALFALNEEREFVKGHSGGQWIFTPHAGEFQRLIADPDVSQIRAARSFARDWNVVLLLKGMPSITAAPDGRVIVNDTGNPAAATAGSGDVLAGMIAGLISQGLEPFNAAAAAVHVAGAIADDYILTRSAGSMMAGDVVDELPEFLGRLE